VVCITETGEKIEMFYIDGEPVIVHSKFGSQPSSLKQLSEQNAFGLFPMKERLLIVAFLCVSGVWDMGDLDRKTNADEQMKLFGFNPNMN